MKTFWIVPSRCSNSVASSLPTEEEHDCVTRNPVEIAVEQGPETKKLRLVKWNVEVLSSYIRSILVDRASSSQDSSHEDLDGAERSLNNEMKVPMEDVVNVLSMPSLKKVKMSTSPAAVSIPEGALRELRAYVTEIANLYKDVPFHCFSHASHVRLSLISFRTVPTDNFRCRL